MSDEGEREFWAAAYLAAIRFGSSSYQARTTAEQAVEDLRERWPEPEPRLPLGYRDLNCADCGIPDCIHLGSANRKKLIPELEE